jgi:hypothetical protein
MSLSKGNPISSVAKKHSIALHIPYLQNRGFATTNITDMRSFLSNKKFSKETFNGIESLPEGSSNQHVFDLFESIMKSIGIPHQQGSRGSNTTGGLQYYYVKYNKESGSFQKVTISTDSIIRLIEFHEENHETGTSSPSSSRQEIRDIQNSLHGSIVGTIGGQDVDTHNVDESSRVEKAVEIFFLGSKNQYGRVVATKGFPNIVESPRTAAGSRYSHKYSKRISSKADATNIATYVRSSGNVLEDSSCPQDDLVCGKLGLTFDDSNGTWTVQNNLMVVAVDTIPSAPVEPLTTISEYAAGNKKPENIYFGTAEDNPDKSIAGFSTGRAMPVYPQRGNPNLYGPKFFRNREDDADTPEAIKKPEIIRVVNRFSSTIDAGTLFMVSKINGEWIPVIAPTPGETVVPTVTSKWGFQQYIVNSDSFFVDTSYYDNRQDGRTYSYGSASINLAKPPDSYQDLSGGKMKQYYRAAVINNYSNGLNLLNDNPYDPQFNSPKTESLISFPKSMSNPRPTFSIPVGQYNKVSSFDYVDSSLGGISPRTILQRTNPHTGDGVYSLGGMFPLQIEIPLFFGCVFPDGFTPETAGKLQSSQGIQCASIGGGGTQLAHSAVVSTVRTASTTTVSNGSVTYYNADEFGYGNVVLKTDNPGFGMFKDESDSNLKQLPADIGTHASPDGSYGMPLRTMEHQKMTLNLQSEDVEGYLFRLLEGVHLAPNDPELGEVFDLRPINPKKICFMPLQQELAFLHKDVDIAVPSVTADDYGFTFQHFLGYANYQSVNEPGAESTLNVPDIGRLFINYEYDIPSRLNGTHIGEAKNRIWPRVIPTNRRAKYGLPHLDNPSYNPLLQGRDFPYKSFYHFGIIGANTNISIGNKDTFTINTLESFGHGGFTTGGAVPQPTFNFVGLGGLAASLVSFNAPAGALFDNTQWGSRDGEDDAGTAVLYLQVYHEWPEEDTLFDARYNVVLHFNPKFRSNGEEPTTLYNKGVSEPDDLEFDDSGFIVANWHRNVDNITSSVEYRVPSVIGLGASEYTEMDAGTVITVYTPVGNPTEWKVDRSRNRRLLPYVHKRKVLGINDRATFIVSGSFGDNEINTNFNCANGIVIKVTGTDSFIVLDPGSGFAPKDFDPETDYFTFTAGNVTLRAKSGKVVNMVHRDDAPEQVVSSQKINVGSANGRNAGANGGSANVNLIGNLHPKGRYNLFFFFQNDCSFVSMTPWIGDAGFQFLEIEIV